MSNALLQTNLFAEYAVLSRYIFVCISLCDHRTESDFKYSELCS